MSDREALEALDYAHQSEVAMQAKIDALQAELRALSKVIVDHLGGGSEWFKQIGDDYFVSAKAIEGELRRRKTDAQITKRALVRANTSLSLAKGEQ